MLMNFVCLPERGTLNSVILAEKTSAEQMSVLVIVIVTWREL